MRIKAVLVLFVLTLLFWVGFNLSIRSDVLISGLVLSALTAFLFSGSTLMKDLRLGPASFGAMIAWLAVFSLELVKSNIDVMRRVVAPRVRINPAIVEVQTRLKTESGRLALANSITLTPGTLTTDIIGDRLYIHWIDAAATDLEGATRRIVEKFEKYLEVIFG